MSNRKLRPKRGTTVQNNAYTGAEGEITVDTDKKTVVVHDGTTAGGHPIVGGGGGAPTISVDTNLLVPSQYATIGAALDVAMNAVVLDGAKVTIIVDAAVHTIAEQVVIKNGDFSWLHITTSGGTASVDSTSFVNNNPFGENPLFYIENATVNISGDYINDTGSTVCAVFTYAAKVILGTGFTSSSFSDFGTSGGLATIYATFSDIGMANVSILNCKGRGLHLVSSFGRWDVGVASLSLGTNRNLIVLSKSHLICSPTSFDNGDAISVACVDVSYSHLNCTISGGITIQNAPLLTALGSEVHLQTSGALAVTWNSGSPKGITAYRGSKVWMKIFSATASPAPSPGQSVYVEEGSIVTAIGLNAHYTGGYNQAVNTPTANGLIFG